jgi:hypothetical protein
MADPHAFQTLAALVIDDAQNNGETVCASLAAHKVGSITWMRFDPNLEPSELEGNLNRGYLEARRRLANHAPHAVYAPFGSEDAAALFITETFKNRDLLVFCDLNLGGSSREKLFAHLVQLLVDNSNAGRTVYLVIHSTELDNANYRATLGILASLNGRHCRWSQALTGAVDAQTQNLANELVLMGLERWTGALDPANIWWPPEIRTRNYFEDTCGGNSEHDWLGHDFVENCPSCKRVASREFGWYLRHVFKHRAVPDEWFDAEQLPGLHQEMKYWLGKRRALTLGALLLLTASVAPAHVPIRMNWKNFRKASPLVDVDNQLEEQPAQLLRALVSPDNGLLSVIVAPRDGEPLLKEVVVHVPMTSSVPNSRAVRLFLKHSNRLSAAWNPRSGGNLSQAFLAVEDLLSMSKSGRASGVRINFRQMDDGHQVLEFVECALPKLTNTL